MATLYVRCFKGFFFSLDINMDKSITATEFEEDSERNVENVRANYFGYN